MNRLNLVLVVLLALQLAFLGASKIFGSDRFTPRASVTGDRMFASLAEGKDVASVEIVANGTTTELRRDGEQWRVATENDAPADVTAANGLADALARMKPGHVVSENPAKHEDFEVAGTKAVRVSAKSTGGQTVGPFILGKTTPDWKGVYVRFPADSNDVMLVTSNVRSTFVRDENKKGGWRDKSIFKADAKNVREFEIVRAEETILVRRELKPAEEGKEPAATDEDDWKVVQPIEGKMSRYSANSMATTIASLSCDSYYTGDQKPADLKLEPPEARVTAKLADGSALVLEIGSEDSYRRYARVPGRDEVFQVSSGRLYEFLKKSADMVEKPPEPPASAPAADTAPATEPGSGGDSNAAPAAPATGGDAPPAGGNDGAQGGG